MKTFSLHKLVHVLPLIAVAFAVYGCGDSGGAGPDPKAEAARVETAKGMRSYFDKVKGDYAKLDATDKAAYIKLCGGEKKADENWSLMKNGPGGANRAGSPGGN